MNLAISLFIMIKTEVPALLINHKMGYLTFTTTKNGVPHILINHKRRTSLFDKPQIEYLTF